MKVVIAKSAGFCFGVRRAVESVERELDKGETICTLGELMHNRQAVEALEKRGVTATVRRRLGPDIDAACGQLRRREMKEQG